ncbi:hypothetical protein Asphe3_27580 [Pseudarthrobacter phenanthrenivorans Sphe3]|uniref:Uncharacterized protein n=1 Tax=Pseudarthrobacter phenanthrenivorans (strain DSM 18606 / JCM 16027 / LMG 23796 / Sphe3) TaxID=930171 RepID=F0M9U6_PSEPM|nr:DUF6541 family protein [Pseudarthrobacter phenanthrenivorans]ADX73876.1 hypothetical protein Asphe3_27580 [Pseudarthrobacter phenanthrenivorans Sphe3]
MEWVLALPGLAGAAAVLLCPGLLLGWALGLRHVWMISLAPVLTASLVAVSTLAAWWLHIGWNVGVFAVTAVFFAGAVLVMVRLISKRWPDSFAWWPAGDTAGAAYWIALLIGGFFLAVRYVQIVERPGNINQGIDTPFHLNLVQQILNSGDGSPFSVRALMGEPAGFYPQIWHALVALTAQVTRLPVVEAANVLNFAIVAVSWPLGVLLLVYLVVGPKTVALVCAGVATAGFFAFPFTVMQSQKSDFGPLFPYMLAVTFLPPLIAVLATALKFGNRTPMPWPLAAATLALGLPGLVNTHMSGLVALVGLSTTFAVVAALRSFRELKQRRSDLYGYLKWTALWITAFSAGLIVWAVVRPWTTTWDPIDTFPAAAGSVLLTAPTHGDVAWALAALTLIGTAQLVRQPTARWFLASYGGAVALYLVAAAVPASAPLVRELIIGAWYGDPPRLAALLPMFWAVFAGAAGAWIFESLKRYRVRWVVPVGIAALSVSIVIWPTNSETAPGRERTYALADASPLLSPNELELLSRLGTHVPRDAVIANNPWDGSSTAYAIADRRVLFAHAYAGSNPDRLLAAERLNRADPESDVCEAVKRENIQFLLDFGGHYVDPKRKEVNEFPGIEVPDNSSAFVKVDQEGDAALYRFVGCES